MYENKISSLTAQSPEQLRLTSHSHDGIEKLPKNPYSRRHEIPVETSQRKNMREPSLAPSVQLQQTKLMNRMTSETSRTPVIRAILSWPFIKTGSPGRKIVVSISHGIPKQIRMSKILLPIELEMAILHFPCLTTIKLDMISGTLEPAASSVKPWKNMIKNLETIIEEGWWLGSFVIPATESGILILKAEK